MRSVPAPGGATQCARAGISVLEPELLNHTQNMKKTLIALLALSGMALGATTTVIDVTKDLATSDVTYTAPHDSITMGSFTGSGIYATGGGGVAEAGLTFVLDLTALNEITRQTKIVNFDETYDLGLFWGQYNGEWGLMGNWNGGTWANNGGCFTAYTTLVSSAFTVEDSDHSYITLTVTTANPKSGNQSGEQLYVAGSNSSLFSDSTGLGTSNNQSISSVSFDTTLVKSAAITSGWVPGTTAATLGSTLQDTYIEAHKSPVVPEPATGTLSLLALAGLCGRRRRK